MFIDYLTVIMINLVAGSGLLAYYLWRGIDEPDQRPYAAAFFGVGLVALITGLHLSFNWPLPDGSTNLLPTRYFSTSRYTHTTSNPFSSAS